jgi:hypothetical protein
VTIRDAVKIQFYTMMHGQRNIKLVRKVDEMGEKMGVGVGRGNVCPLIPAHFYLQNH